jgi:hypothetical protein
MLFVEFPPPGDRPASAPSVYEHDNMFAWENSILDQLGLTHIVVVGYRIMMDAFYGTIGFRNVFELGESHNKPDGYKSRDEVVEEQWDYLIKKGFDGSMIEQLYGRDCEYKESHAWAHSMQVNIVGACLSKYVRQTDDKKRDAYLAVWTFLTGYKSFLEGIHDERWMSAAGVYKPQKGVLRADIFN